MKTAHTVTQDPEEFLRSLTEAERMVIAFGELSCDSKFRRLSDAERVTLDAGRMIVAQMPPARLAEIFRAFKIAL